MAQRAEFGRANFSARLSRGQRCHDTIRCRNRTKYVGRRGGGGDAQLAAECGCVWRARICHARIGTRRNICSSQGGIMKVLRLVFVVAIATASLFSLSLMRAAAAPSSTIVVNSTLDGSLVNDGNCTLREAIFNAD